MLSYFNELESHFVQLIPDYWEHETLSADHQTGITKTMLNATDITFVVIFVLEAVTLFLFYKNIVFPAQAEYSYFSADFRLKYSCNILNYSL